MQRFLTFHSSIRLSLFALIFGGVLNSLATGAAAGQPVILLRSGEKGPDKEAKNTWHIHVQPRIMTGEEKIGQTYWRIYRSLPYISTVQYFNPRYRHEMTLHILFGNQPSGKQPMPPEPAPAHVGID